MGLRLLLATAVAATPAGFLQAHQQPSGAFAESGGTAGSELTAWAALGLRAAGADTGGALQYLQAHENGLPEITDAELVAVAEGALGRRPAALLDRIRKAQRPDGRIGPNVNSTIWGILALRQSGVRTPRPTVGIRYPDEGGDEFWGVRDAVEFSLRGGLADVVPCEAAGRTVAKKSSIDCSRSVGEL